MKEGFAAERIFFKGHLECEKNDDQRAKKTSLGVAMPTPDSWNSALKNRLHSATACEENVARLLVPNLCQNQSENSPKISPEASPKTEHNSKLGNALVIVWHGVAVSLRRFPKLDVVGSNPIARS